MQNLESTIRNGIAELKRERPWIGTIVDSLELVITDQFKTMATNGKQLFVNAKFAMSLTRPTLKGVLVHEGVHVTNKHMCRRGDRHPRLWNMACDHAVNDKVTKLRYLLPDGALAGIENMTAERIYAELYADQEQDEPEQDETGESGETGETGESEQDETGDSGDSGESEQDESEQDESGESGESGEGDSEASDGADDSEGGDDTGNTSDGAEGDSDAAEGGSGNIGNPETAEDVDLLDYPLEPGQTMADAEREIDELMARADVACTMAGTKPSYAESKWIINRERETDLNWPHELENFMLQKGGANFTMNPPHLGLLSQNIVCNQLNPQGCGNVVLVVDASGSIDEDKLELAVTHLELFLANIDYESLRLIVHDTDVDVDREFMRGEPVDLSQVCAGGGTDFAPVYDLIGEGESPDLVIHFTDMGTRDMDDYPEPDYPVVWLVDAPGDVKNGEWTDSARADYWTFTPDWGHIIDARQ